MKLFLLERKELAPYDQYNRFVIRTKSPIRARRMANELDTDDKFDVWLDKSKTTCSILKKDGKEEVVISDFIAA